MATKLITPPRPVSARFAAPETEKFETRSQREFYEKLASLLTIEDWKAPTLLNGWVNYGGEHEPAGYYKDPFGIVHVRGLIKDGTTTKGTVLFTLLPGYRPEHRIIHLDATQTGGSFPNSDPARIDVFKNGDVVIIQGNSGFIDLGGLSFRAA